MPVKKSQYSIESLLGDSSSFTSMSPKEREYFIQILQEEMKRREDTSTPELIRPIVPIETWIESEYYVGKDVHGIYPFWKDFIIDVFREDRKPEEKINQVILGGSIGIGKSTCAEIIMLRKLYELSCWKNINALFDLMSKTSIMFLYFSVNKTQAERTGFGEIRSWVDRSPYFKENFPRRSRLNDILIFPEGITFAYGSGSSDSIGMSVIGTIMDEANFSGGHRDTGNAERASEMYAGIVNRANSRFIIRGGENYSLNILVSSATTENSVTERQIAASKDDPHTIVCAPSQWEVKPDKFSKKFFFVLKGTDYLEPQIIRSTDDVNNFRISEGMKKEKFVDGLESYNDIEKEIKKLPEHQQTKFLRVPEDLRPGFETNIMRSLQDMGGVSIASTGKLFNSVAVYNACIKENFHHPFVADSIIISTGDTIEIKDYLRSDFRLKHPERPRFIHIDQSFRTDDTGISCVYIDEVLEEDGVKKPVFGVDFMLQINPPNPPKKIAIYKIRNFVVFLATKLGMKFGMVSYDIFNSEESRQILEEMGYNVKYQSVDRTDKAYLDTVEVMYEGRLRMYDYKIFRSEIFNVIHYRDKRKVDHPDKNPDGTTGKKDVADSLCLSYDTKLFLLSGKELTIEELYNSWEESCDEWILACDVDNQKIVPVKVEEVIRKKNIPDVLYRVSLDNGETFSVTGDHLVLMRDGSYKKACDLELNDSLMPFVTSKDYFYKDYYRSVMNPFGVGRRKFTRIYKLVVNETKREEFDNVDLSDGSAFKVIHHVNHNKLDDRPSNLNPMSNIAHRNLHGDIFRRYNKSDEKRERLKELHSEGKLHSFKDIWSNPEQAERVKEISRDLMIKYNKSDKHKKDVKKARERGAYEKADEKFIEMAKDKEVHKKSLETWRLRGYDKASSERISNYNQDPNNIRYQLLGKVKVVVSLLREHTDILDGRDVSMVDIMQGVNYLKDEGLISNSYGCPYDYSLFEEIGVNLIYVPFEDVPQLRKLTNRVSKIQRFYKMMIENVSDFPKGNITVKDFKNGVSSLRKQGLINKNDFCRTDYDLLVLAHLPIYNHRVVNIEIIPNNHFVYDLRLNSIHNFGIDAGVFVHNCGAIENAIQFKISDGAQEGNTLNDFLYANDRNVYFEPDAMTAEEMVDKQIDDMIEAMEADMGGITFF